jgi:radical SAM protein with 4Fe4S-binding SPASM domain
VRESDIKEIWDNSSTFDIFRNITRGNLKGKCSNCEYLGIMCYEGCRAAALAHTDDLYAEDPTCWKELA